MHDFTSYTHFADEKMEAWAERCSNLSEAMLRWNWCSDLVLFDTEWSSLRTEGMGRGVDIFLEDSTSLSQPTGGS